MPFLASSPGRGVHSGPGGVAETVTRRQPQGRAGQVVRTDRTAPYALPPRQLNRPARRDLRSFSRGRRISNPVPGGLPGHRVLCRTPLRNSSSTSACRYRGRPASLRTSGNRPRCAHFATAAEVTPNKDATCLRVIRSSPTRLPAAAGAADSRAADSRAADSRAADAAGAQPGQTDISAIMFIGSLPGRNELKPGQRWSLHATTPGQGPGTLPNRPVPVALQMVLQIAARNIGQLTDIEPPPPASKHHANIRQGG